MNIPIDNLPTIPKVNETKQLFLKQGTVLINRYSISESLSIGKTCSFYKARDLHFSSVDRYVLIKEFINQSADSKQQKTYIQNYERQVGIFATLDHPSIPVILDYFSIEGRSYLVFEDINGKDMDTTISETTGFINEDIVIDWAIDLCDVLGYLHAHKPDPIILNDLQSSDILINSLGKIVLIDFGISNLFQTRASGTIVGTEGYSAPELDRGVASPLADIYTLGAILHHALSRLDLRNQPAYSINERQLGNTKPSISKEFDAVITKSLQPNPDDRYQSAFLMKEALLEVRKHSTNEKEPGLITQRTDEINRPLWIYKCNDEIRGAISWQDDSIFFGSYDHNLYSLRVIDGSLNWKYQTEAGIVAQPAIHENEVYIGSEDQRLHVVNKRTGKIIWSYYCGGRVCSSPKIAEGHVFIGSDDAYLHAINLMSTRSVWRFEAASPIRSTPYITNEMIYFGSESGIFYALDFHGDIVWTYATKNGISSSPVMSDGLVFFASRDCYVYALDARGGWVKWRFHMTKGSNSSPFIKEGILYIGSADGNIYALDSHTGKEIWRYPTTHQVSSSPTIDNDAVFCGSADGYLYCLDSQAGTLRWRYLTQGAITARPIIINDIVYVGSLDHCLYAFSL